MWLVLYNKLYVLYIMMVIILIIIVKKVIKSADYRHVACIIREDTHKKTFFSDRTTKVWGVSPPPLDPSAWFNFLFVHFSNFYRKKAKILSGSGGLLNPPPPPSLVVRPLLSCVSSLSLSESFDFFSCYTCSPCSHMANIEKAPFASA